MNYTHLSDIELINYLDLTNDDPVVRRLLKIIDNGLLSELVEAGMDPTDRTFEHDWQHLSPGEYIDQLRRDMEYYIDERDQAEVDRDQAQEKVKQLEAMSVADLIYELKNKAEVAISEAHSARRRAEHAIQEKEEMRDKLKVWNHLKA